VSALAATSSAASSLPATSLPPIDQALEPESVRNGNQAAKNAYQEGLAFEDILVNQLAQEMTQTVPGLDGGDDGLGGTTSSDDSDGSDDSSGLDGSDSAISAYSSLLPQALTTGIMSAGGTGIALQIAQSLDPALANPKAATTAKAGDGS
jgi:Rod binding domain-containing protein